MPQIVWRHRFIGLKCLYFSEIDLLDFTAFIEPTNFEISIGMFSMDREANEVFYEGNDTTVFAGSVD